jgi:purine-binding chemotaxis protein CheW
MDHDALIRRIEAGAEGPAPAGGEAGKGDAAPVETAKFLVVRIGEAAYAFEADRIKEIALDAPLHYIPFVPPYIRGLINRHGEPYTAYDLNVLFEKETLEAATYVISHFNDDRIAFMVSDISEIMKIPRTDIQPITAAEAHGAYFSGVIPSDAADILVLDLAAVTAKLEHDLRSR